MLEHLKPRQQATLIVMVFFFKLCGLKDQDNELWSLSCFFGVLQVLKPQQQATFIFMVFFPTTHPLRLR